MGASRFDRWSRVAAVGSRRSVLHGTIVASLGLVASSVLGPRTIAQVRSAPDAVAFCRFLDEVGELDPSFTQGECVAAHKERRSSEAKSHFAGFCGQPLVQQFLMVRNKGECIQVVSGMD